MFGRLYELSRAQLRSYLVVTYDFSHATKEKKKGDGSLSTKKKSNQIPKKKTKKAIGSLGALGWGFGAVSGERSLH
jgi:hypothetical protein